MMQLTQALHRNLRASPTGIATIDGATRRTWAETVDRIASRARILCESGMAGGDRVAVLARNSADMFETLMAVLWSGGVIVPINVRWSAEEMTFALRDCGASLLIVGDEFKPLSEDLLDGLFTRGRTLPVHLYKAAPPLDDRLRAGNDLAAILYTGGTTGRPKGVMLSHGNLMASALGYAGNGQCAPGAAMLHTAPMFHIGALSGIFAAMLRGSRHMFLPGFDPLGLMRAIAAERITDTFMVPTMLHMLLDHPQIGAFELSSVERIIYGAAPMTPALMDRAISVFPNVGFVQAYGMTELSPVVTLLGPADHGPEAQASGRIRSAGRPTMTVEARIVGSDDVELPRGEVGEIVARGATVMQGYWNLPEETAHALRGGWMHTGDAGWMSEDGYIHIVDRLKDMIISGGENIYSAEVEHTLSQHPAVAQCAVVGVPDPKWGERVHAAVVLRQGAVADEGALVSHCRDRIAGFKCPKTFEFREALPLSPIGKILKAQLRNELGASPEAGQSGAPGTAT